MVVSSVSPLRWDTITPQPACCDILQAWIDSVTDPIWFTFSSRQLQAFLSMASCTLFGLVTVRSSLRHHNHCRACIIREKYNANVSASNKHQLSAKKQTVHKQTVLSVCHCCIRQYLYYNSPFLFVDLSLLIIAAGTACGTVIGWQGAQCGGWHSAVYAVLGWPAADQHGMQHHRGNSAFFKSRA